jgi:hypothetical protein
MSSERKHTVCSDYVRFIAKELIHDYDTLLKKFSDFPVPSRE